MTRFSRSLAAAALGALAAFVPSAAIAADIWQIDASHSSAQFAVTHLMISTVRGSFGKTSGTLEYDGKDVLSIKVDATIDRFVTDRSTTGFLKVVFDPQRRVIGADAIGAHAGEWIQLLTVAIKNQIPAQSFADTIFAYPTYSEIVKKAFTRFLRSQP